MVIFDLYPRKCAMCGKRFESSHEYVYRIGGLKKKPQWFCSWKCIQAFRRKECKSG